MFLYGCESWTLTADLERRIQALVTKCQRRMLGIAYKEHETSGYGWQQVGVLVERQGLLLSTVKHRKLSWSGRVSSHGALPTIVLRGYGGGLRRRGGPRGSWRDGIE